MKDYYSILIFKNSFIGNCNTIGLLIEPIFGTLSLIIYFTLFFSNPGYIPKFQNKEISIKEYPNSYLHNCEYCDSYIPKGTYHCEYCDMCCEEVY